MDNSDHRRILMLNYECPPVGGGGGVAALKMAKAFVSCGYKVDYVTSLFKGQDRIEDIGGVTVHRVPVIFRKSLNASTTLSLLSYPISAFFYARKLCRHKKYEFINSHFAIPSGVIGVWLSKIFGIPHTLCVHGGDVYEPTRKHSPHRHFILRLLVKYALNNSSLISVYSRDIRQRLVSIYGVDQGLIHIINMPYDGHSIDWGRRSDLGLKDNVVYLISIGRMVSRKGFRFLVESLASLPDDYELILIGDGPEHSLLRQVAMNKDVLNRIHFLGNISDEDKFKYLSVSDIYVLSSIHEGFGIVLQEAMEVGLPIVSTNNGGQTDFIIEEENGLLVPHSNPELLSKKVMEIMGDEKLRRHISEMNLRDIKKFSSSAVIADYLDKVNEKIHI